MQAKQAKKTFKMNKHVLQQRKNEKESNFNYISMIKNGQKEYLKKSEVIRYLYM